MQNDLREALESAANISGRSLNAEIVARLQSSLEKAPNQQASELEAIQLAVREAVRDELKEILPKPKAK
ncbi:Arc family DNA-binding protein [Chitinibacter bivalviorum]|nr:Arc family DNA-binding protein [Chitinibacter bivalviorum]